MKRLFFVLLFCLLPKLLRGQNYILFQHNMFLELFGTSGRHPEYGKAEYTAIVDAFKKDGFNVISELRPKDTDPHVYAQKVAHQVDSLLKKGVPASHITIVGTSKGGYIAACTSSLLKNRELNYVFVGCCVDEERLYDGILFYGNVLSIYEISDSSGHSCQRQHIRAGNTLKRFKEIELHTGLKHGYLYKALDEWIKPAEKWARQNYDAPTAIDAPSLIDWRLEATSHKPFNGIVMVAQNGATRYARCFGMADLFKEIPLKLSDQFVIGSISEQITAVLTLQTYEKGIIKLNIPIRHYLPNLPNKWADSVTVDQLLAYTHGIDEDDPEKPLKFKPGSAFDYSRRGYDLLAQILEQTTHKSFAQLAGELFIRCGMNNTCHPDAHKDSNLVKCYEDGGHSQLKVIIPGKLKQVPPVAACGFISTAEDLATWNNCLHNNKLLSPKTYELMITPKKNAIRQHPVHGPTLYGYGITTETLNGLVQLGQTGSTSGYPCMNFYYPKTKTSLVILSNTAWEPGQPQKTFQHHLGIQKLVKESQWVK